MKNTGVTRKIDELGRIVIPKEIRKNLNIKNSEDLQIYVDDDSIILKKYKKMYSFREKAQDILNVFSKLSDAIFIITDKEIVIASTSSSLINCQIDKKIIELIVDRKNEKGNRSFFENNNSESYYYVNPIIIDADAIGTVIVINKKEITEQQMLLVKVINALLLSFIY